MDTLDCETESRVLEAAATGVWEPALRRHARECPVCAEVLLVFDYLDEEARAVPAADVTSAGVILWKRSLRDAAAVERSLMPIAIVQPAAVLVSLLALCAIASWYWRTGAVDLPGSLVTMFALVMSMFLSVQCAVLAVWYLRNCHEEPSAP